MEFSGTKIPGCFVVTPRVLEDNRGSFIKTFHDEIFRDQGLETNWNEEYYSVSKRGVLRGLHFQLPPYAHAKLVYCSAGQVLDAVVDLRVGSPTYGDFGMFNLDSEKSQMVYVPAGLAHGFYTLSEAATMMYKVGTVYAPDSDSGILWGSAGIPWPDQSPILSTRDAGFLPLGDFVSPFLYEED